MRVSSWAPGALAPIRIEVLLTIGSSSPEAMLRQASGVGSCVLPTSGLLLALVHFESLPPSLLVFIVI